MTRKIINALNKRFPDSHFCVGTDIPKISKVHSGSIMLDFVLGGGYPSRGFVEIFGKPGCGKTLLCMLAIKAAQERGESTMWIDAEKSFDPEQAKLLGIDLGKLLFMSPTSGEDIGNAMNTAIESGIDLLVVDSVAATTPKKETNDDIAQQNIGLHARLMNKILRVISSKMLLTGSTILLINQQRASLDLYSGINTTGGQGIDYYCSQRLQVLKPDRKGRSDGMTVRFKMYKNRFGDLKDGTVDIKWDGGVDTNKETILMGIELGIIEKKGAWYYYGDNKSQGADGISDWDVSIIKKILKDVKKFI